MQYTYVGIDSHKDTHTAVFLDCFFDKLGEITFENLPNKFDAFLEKARQFKQDGTTFMFGLEDASSFGRSLMRFLTDNGQPVKHVNSLLVARERKNRNFTEKTDSVDAECAARVLLSKFGELPDVAQQNQYWVLRSLVSRRDILVRHRAATKNYLHTLLTQHYPNYRQFFAGVDGETSRAFFMRYPSPGTLKSTTAAELAAFLKSYHAPYGMAKAEEILNSLQDTGVPFQEVRDTVVQSTIQQLYYYKEEINRLEAGMSDFLRTFNCTLTSMHGIDVVSAAQLLSCIGDIKKFATPAKLARYAGIAPVSYSSGKKDLQFASQRGNRELNGLFYRLAMFHISTPGRDKSKIRNSIFYEYYHRKIAEGKTKNQAMKCVQRRLVNIIWGLLTHGEPYVNPPILDLHDEPADTKAKDAR